MTVRNQSIVYLATSFTIGYHHGSAEKGPLVKTHQYKACEIERSQKCIAEIAAEILLETLNIV